MTPLSVGSTLVIGQGEKASRHEIKGIRPEPDGRVEIDPPMDGIVCYNATLLQGLIERGAIVVEDTSEPYRGEAAITVEPATPVYFDFGNGLGGSFLVYGSEHRRVNGKQCRLILEVLP